MVSLSWEALFLLTHITALAFRAEFRSAPPPQIPQPNYQEQPPKFIFLQQNSSNYPLPPALHHTKWAMIKIKMNLRKMLPRRAILGFSGGDGNFKRVLYFICVNCRKTKAPRVVIYNNDSSICVSPRERKKSERGKMRVALFKSSSRRLLSL